jgi:hypothetical protein
MPANISNVAQALPSLSSVRMMNSAGEPRIEVMSVIFFASLFGWSLSALSLY